MRRILTFLVVACLNLTDTQAQTLPERSVGSNTGVQLLSHDNIKKSLNIGKQIGFGIIRKGLYWNQIEKRKGKYDFRYYDHFFDEAAKRGFVVSATLFSNNPLYEKGSNRAILTPAGREGFAKFAQMAAERYKDKKIIWEIWNEPNTRGFWRPGADSKEAAGEYTELVRAVVPAMRAKAPDAYIVAGSISALWHQSYKWFDHAIQLGLLNTGINAVSVHPYGLCRPELALSEGYPAIRKRMDKAGKTQMAIVNSEVGYDTDYINKCLGYEGPEAQEVQGWLFVRQQLIDLMSQIGYSVWFQLREGNLWGLVDNDYQPRPSYQAARTFFEQLAGYQYVKRISTASPDDFVLLMQNKSGQRKLAAWTTEANTSGGNVIQRIVDTSRQTKHEIDLPIEGIGTGTTRYVGVDGNEGQLPITEGKIRLLLEGGVKYIELPSGSKIEDPRG